MVARGEIGFLIVQIGYNQTSYVSDAGLNIAIWATLLNTIIGPIILVLLIKFTEKVLVVVHGRHGARVRRRGPNNSQGSLRFTF
jgi:hypothetical protein